MDGKEAPADGVITGWGDVDGRPCAIAAYDFTVMAGSMGMTGELKVGRLREMALQKRMPLIWLLDSAGARIQEAAGSMFAGSGHLFREEVVMSGVVPLVAGDARPLRGGHRLHPRPLRLRADGRRPGRDGARRAAPDQGGDRRGHLDGGARRRQGPLPQVRASATSRSQDDAECIEAIKTYLSYFPSNCEQKPPVRETDDPEDRMSEKLLDIVPESSRQPYDMYEVIREIVDDGEYLRHQAEVREDAHHLPRPLRRPCRSGSSPTSPSSSAGSSRTTRPTRRRASSTSATPSTSRSSSSRTCPGSWSARRSSTPGSSATARRCSTRSRARRCRRSPSSSARPTAPATT